MQKTGCHHSFKHPLPLLECDPLGYKFSCAYDLSNLNLGNQVLKIFLNNVTFILKKQVCSTSGKFRREKDYLEMHHKINAINTVMLCKNICIYLFHNCFLFLYILHYILISFQINSFVCLQFYTQMQWILITSTLLLSSSSPRITLPTPPYQLHVFLSLLKNKLLHFPLSKFIVYGILSYSSIPSSHILGSEHTTDNQYLGNKKLSTVANGSCPLTKNHGPEHSLFSDELTHIILSYLFCFNFQKSALMSP